MITARDLKAGVFVEINGELFTVLDVQHHKSQNRRALAKTQLRNLETGLISDRSFRSEEAISQIHIEQKTMQYLYKDESQYHFMDQATYDQVGIKKSALGDISKFLKDGMEVTASLYKNRIVSVTLPPAVELKVTYTEPGIKGDTAKSGTKPATLETGTVIKVPLFINIDDVVKVNTRTGEYAGRA